MRQSTILSTLTFSVFAACSGGGGGGSAGQIAGLRGPQQVTLVQASDGGTGSLTLSLLSSGTTANSNAEPSDYDADPTNLWVRDDSMQNLETVNWILASLEQTRYYDQTNAGPYRALVSQDDDSGERGNNATTYEEWIVDSKRTDNDSPQTVDFWILQEETRDSESGPSQEIIYGHLVVTEEPTDAQPLGQFSLRFKALPASAASTSTETLFEGYLRTVARNDGLSEVEFFMSNGDPDAALSPGDEASRERVHVIGDPASDTGRAYSESKYAGEGESGPFTEVSEYQLQFNADYVARRDVANGNVLSVLDRGDVTTTIHRYGVYNAETGARLEQLSGFPVQTEDGKNGWAGFHGVWFSDSVTLTDGMTLYRRNFDTGVRTPYTLVIAPGKLEKRTRTAITLADLQNQDLDTFDPQVGGEQRLRFTGDDFVRVATRSGETWVRTDPPVSVVSNYTSGQWLTFWSQGRGSVEFAWPSVLEGTTPAYVWSSTTIDSDSTDLANGDLTLYGYSHMLRSAITSEQANFEGSASPYFPDATSPTSGNKVYVFDRDELLLKLDDVAVTLLDGVTVSSGPGMHGLNCGPLFPAALASFEEFSTQTVSYEWHTGTNSWNQLRKLKDGAGQFVNFDPPTRFSYVHRETGSDFDGRTFLLEWDGSHLGGIPGEQDDNRRWQPVFDIPSGTTVTNGSTTYKIKQLEGEQQFLPVGDPTSVFEAQGFDLDSAISAPNALPYSDPAIGAVPTVTAAPLYVGGELQTSSD